MKKEKENWKPSIKSEGRHVSTAFIVIVVLVVIVVGGTFAVNMIYDSKKEKVEEALKKQVNVEIDMSKVADGTYTGSSDCEVVQAEVEVTVKDHKITEVKLLRHVTGQGESAEGIVNEMVKQNTYDVDGVSGATYSSNTIKNAVNVALQKGLS